MTSINLQTINLLVVIVNTFFLGTIILLMITANTEMFKRDKSKSEKVEEVKKTLEISSNKNIDKMNSLAQENTLQEIKDKN